MSLLFLALLLPLLHSSENGGWLPPTPAEWKDLGTSRCDVDRISPEQLEKVFFQKYYMKAPVIVTYNTSDWTDPIAWSRESLMTTYKDLTVYLGRSDFIVKERGSGYQESTLADFLKDQQVTKNRIGEPFYLFDRDFYPSSELAASVHLPPIFAEFSDKPTISFIGGSYTGVSFHRHHNAINCIAYGQKRWFFYGPAQTPPGGIWPGFSQLDWLRLVYPTLSYKDMPIDCVQNPGEIMYVPEGWYHAVMNIGETVAIGYQFGAHKDRYMHDAYKFRDLEAEMKYQFSHDEPDKAIESWKELLEVWDYLNATYPDQGEHLCMYAIAKSNYFAYSGETLDDHGRAEIENIFQQVLSVDPQYVLAYVGLARFYIELRRSPEEIRAFLDKALRTNPRNYDAVDTYQAYLYDTFIEDVDYGQVEPEILLEEAKFLLTLFQQWAELRDNSYGVLEDADYYRRLGYVSHYVFLHENKSKSVSVLEEKYQNP